ncbi:hypothetical protein CICLE_v10024587mg [Citrus x clementina]|uniref:Cytochrome P450 n=1 Tax=Citrus clementina TaxID=85681 RepID=V4U151_CITCL|nr:hypothetical protein CICLE_v10024587mg [Citrus x clementina]
MFKTHDIVISNRPKTTPANILLYECQGIGFSNYGEYWRQVRKICVLQLLSVRRVQSFQHVRDGEVSSLITKIRLSCFNKGSPLNLLEMLLIASSNIVSLYVLGRNLMQKKKILFAAFCVGDTFLFLGCLDVLSGLIGRLNATTRAIDALLDRVIEEHTNRASSGSDDDDDQSNKKDFVDILLQLRKDGMLGAELSQDNLKAVILDMFVAGTDTTATTLEWAMAELMKNPTSMKRAREEVRSVAKGKLNIDMKDIEKMDYLKCVVKETLRLHPPTPLLAPREITEVIVNAWAIQRDPQGWDRPEDFLSDRFLNSLVDCKSQDFEFISFGAGRRGYLGTSFALVEVEYVIANLLYWFDWNLPLGKVEENLDMFEVNGLVVHKKLPLHPVPTLYSPYP